MVVLIFPNLILIFPDLILIFPDLILIFQCLLVLQTQPNPPKKLFVKFLLFWGVETYSNQIISKF